MTRTARIKKIFSDFWKGDKYMLGIRDDKLSVRGLYACQCGCGFNCIKDKIIDMLQVMQDVLDSPEAKADGINIDLSARINSACRCEKHNESKKVGGKKGSEHCTGEAVDISPVSGSRERWWLLEAARQAGFTRIGTGKNLIHLGIGGEPKKASRVNWLY